MKDNRSQDDAEVCARYKLAKAPMMADSIFISYSHKDQKLVEPVVGILRATVRSVFHDVVSITPGKKWEQSVREAIARCDLVVVFWCEHAANSEEVKKEWEFAISESKDLLPLLLDATPLPQVLTQYQWIDFRTLALRKHGIGLSSLALRPLRFLLSLAKVLIEHWGLSAMFLGLIAARFCLDFVIWEKAELKFWAPNSMPDTYIDQLFALPRPAWISRLQLLLNILIGGALFSILKKTVDHIADSNSRKACTVIIAELRRRGFPIFNSED
jgi:hypothetical protein